MGKHSLVLKYKTEGGTSVIKTEDVEGNLWFDISEKGLIPGNMYDYTASYDMQLDEIKGIAIGVSRSPNQSNDLYAEASVFTNDVNAPDDTFATLSPISGLAWTVLDLINPIPLTVPVTTFYVIPTGTAKVDIFISVLADRGE